MSILSSFPSLPSFGPTARHRRLGVLVAAIGAGAWLLAGGVDRWSAAPRPSEPGAPGASVVRPASPSLSAQQGPFAGAAPVLDDEALSLHKGDLSLQSAYEQARLRLQLGHPAEAHRRFALLADCGHRESARIALEVRQSGVQVYGVNFPVGPKRLARWRALLAAPGPLAAQAGAPAAPDCVPPGAASDEQEHWRHQGVG